MLSLCCLPASLCHSGVGQRQGATRNNAHPAPPYAVLHTRPRHLPSDALRPTTLPVRRHVQSQPEAACHRGGTRLSSACLVISRVPNLPTYKATSASFYSHKGRGIAFLRLVLAMPPGTNFGLLVLLSGSPKPSPSLWSHDSFAPHNTPRTMVPVSQRRRSGCSMSGRQRQAAYQ